MSRINKLFWACLILLFPPHLFSQVYVKGVVYEKAGTNMPVSGANVYWTGTSSGTFTDSAGKFSIETSEASNKLVVSFVGFRADTVIYTGQSFIRVELRPENTLEEFRVVEKTDATFISSKDTWKTEIITEKELHKAACCNLSESFETNPSVDVSITDAVTGIKQIQMLGLSGKYSLINFENLPGVGGLSTNYGLSFIPGPWIESIQVTKGPGSVVNGYEAISGQINVELKKPEEKEKWYVNSYLNNMGRAETNLFVRSRISDKWSMANLFHANYTGMRIDVNKDGFLDNPLGRQLNFINRWNYRNKGWEVQTGMKMLTDDRVSGQVNYNPDEVNQTGVYGVNIKTKRMEVFGKGGYVFQKKKYKSIGFMVSAQNFDQDSKIGNSNYTGKQQTLYTNVIFQSIIGNTNHKFKTGLGNVIDNYNENYNSTDYKRNEIVPGAFFEYTNSSLNRLVVVSGIRADYNNLFGLIVTPRLHAKYDYSSGTNFRFSAGRGQRVSNIFSENMGLLVSSRKIAILGGGGKAYGLNPEIAWNSGLNMTHKFEAFNRKGTLSFDLYKTIFINQVMADRDASPDLLLFYNLDGTSRSNSIQTELSYEPVKRLDIKVAYRFLDVKSQYISGFLSQPLLSPHRGFLNLSYATRSKWSFDYTLQWYGKKRIPGTSSNPEQFRMEGQSPSFFLMHAQVSKKINKQWDAYLGMENLMDFRQEHLILSPNDPFSPYFDASLVWGPSVPRMIYTGFRLKI